MRPTRPRAAIATLAMVSSALISAPAASGQSTTGSSLTCNGLAVTVDIGAGQSPTAGDDVVMGTPENDTIDALGGHDTVCAGDGNDTVVGGDGNDVIFGEDGNDALSGNADNDELDGGPGRDRAYGGSGDDLIRGGRGSDMVLAGSSGSDTILGEGGPDTISGGSDPDELLDGGPADDAVNGGGGDDHDVHGGEGDDVVSGNGGSDEINGDEGDDQVRGGPGDDIVRGDDGDDFVAGNEGDDVCDGGPSDTADAFAANCETTHNSWTQILGGTDHDFSSAVALANGDSYTTGTFRGTADFDPGPGVAPMLSRGLADVFVAKLSAGGEVLWVRSFGGTSNEVGGSVDVDSEGNVWIVGSFTGAVDFDPGPASFVLDAGPTADAFAVKLTEDGDFVWAGQFGGSSADSGVDVSVDADDNVLITGSFSATGDFNPGGGQRTLTAAGSSDAFIVKLNSGGGHLWSHSLGGASLDIAANVDADPNGTVYVTGFFVGAGDFDPAPNSEFTITSNGDADVFVVALAASGQFQWAGAYGGLGFDYPTGIDSDGTALYLVGAFELTADFQPGTGQRNLTSAGASDGFFVILNRGTGESLAARRFGGPSDDQPNDVSAIPGGALVTGFFQGVATFGAPSFPNASGDLVLPISALLMSNGDLDIFNAEFDSYSSLVWVQGIGGPELDAGKGIAQLANGQMMVTGNFRGSVDFDPGPVNDTRASAGLADVYVSRQAPGEPIRFGFDLAGASSALCQGSACLQPAPALAAAGEESGRPAPPAN